MAPPVGVLPLDPGCHDDLAARLGLPRLPAAVAAAVLGDRSRRLDLLRHDGGSITLDGTLLGAAAEHGRPVPWRGRVEVDYTVLSGGEEPLLACAVANADGYVEFGPIPGWILSHARDKDPLLLGRYGSPDFGKALGADGNGPFVLAEPGPGLKVEAFKPEAQRLEREFTAGVVKKAGHEPYASDRLAGSGLWLLKLVLDQAKTDDLEKFRSAVMSLDLPVGSMLNGWGVKFAENGQNANERVQHYMLQWQNGQMATVWPEEFSTIRAKWIPLGAWDQRK